MTEPRLTRRTLIGGATAAAAGAAAGPADAAKRRRRPARRRPRQADVVVVGAGFAGLAAAAEVVRAGRSVVVLEARDRVGGRVLNHPIGGGDVVEIGGQWAGPTQDRLLALARELGVETYDTYNTGDNVYFRNGSISRYASTGPLGPVPPDPTGAPEAFLAIQRLNEMALTVPRDAPWAAERALEWDGQTFETWKQANTHTDGGRFLLDLGIEAVWAAEPRDVSLLHVLFYIHSAGNETTPGTFDRLINTAGGAQEKRFVGGSQRIALALAKRLGRRVVLRTPVRRVHHDGRWVRVVSDRLTVDARSAIVAVPPAVTGAIRFEPVLLPMRAQLLQRFPMGTVIKCMAFYDRPFWREEGLTGQATSDTGPCRITFDNTPPGGSPGVLLGFIEGEEARHWSTRHGDERQRAVIESFTRYFGDRAARPRNYLEMRWAEEEYTRGCYGGFTPPGVLTSYGRELRRPHGRVHWAGTETAEIWNGYMEGALRSGERAAREARADL
ncbi:MAG TPA: flavin monoamine oxidase family protein [Solirubrobacteraceae bacterium]|nr:flavin monoamine oxidase family protein [Solirubrobacteraceae bacterium]